MADEAVAKQQCKTLVKIIVIMKMMMITIDIIIMVLRDTDTLERFSPLVSRRKRKFLYLSHHCLWCPKFEKYSDIHQSPWLTLPFDYHKKVPRFRDTRSMSLLPLSS